MRRLSETQLHGLFVFTLGIEIHLLQKFQRDLGGALVGLGAYPYNERYIVGRLVLLEEVEQFLILFVVSVREIVVFNAEVLQPRGRDLVHFVHPLLILTAARDIISVKGVIPVSSGKFEMPPFSKGEFGLMRDLLKIHRADIQDILADPNLSDQERNDFIKGRDLANNLYKKLNSILAAIDNGQL